MGFALIAVSAMAFAGLTFYAWKGSLGLVAIVLLLVAGVCMFLGRRKLTKGQRKPLDMVSKILFTIVGCMALLRHPIDTNVVTVLDEEPTTLSFKVSGESEPLTLTVFDNTEATVEEHQVTPVAGMNTLDVRLAPGTYSFELSDSVDKSVRIQPAMRLPIYSAITAYIDKVDRTAFIMWALVAMAIKFVGVIASAFAWSLLLRGQGLRFPFWQKIMTAFLIGRFIGTFLPSTLGLDGYTLYEAGRYSNQWERVITAKVLEKFIGVTGLFLGMFVTLPLGYVVIQDVMNAAGNPEAAPAVAGLIAAISGGVSLVVVVGLVKPGIIQFFMRILHTIFSKVLVGPLAKIGDKVLGILTRFTGAVGAYEGKVGLLLAALANKFVTHFTTAMVYYFTALAIGVVGAQFWPITFGSTIQILGTVFSPTIAGEGAREAFQAVLLSEQLGGVAQAVLSGALGFIAAEAATMWGGAFLWTRTAEWRPKFATVDGVQVDYSWISEDEPGGFDADRIAAIQREHQQKANSDK
jgi:hypothetical protein